MAEHIRRLAWIGVARSILAILIGSLLVVKAEKLGQSSYGYTRVTVETVAFDQLAFRWLGGLCFFFACLRMAQAGLALVRNSWARPLGLSLALFDIVNLCLFPVSTALGLYALVVYRHPDTLDYFDSRQKARVPAGRS